MASKIIEFDVVFNYADQEEGIEIPLVLNANGQSTMTVGFVDTGCGACLFSNEIGMDLGIDIEIGGTCHFQVRTGGSVPAYGHLHRFPETIEAGLPKPHNRSISATMRRTATIHPFSIYPLSHAHP